MMDVPRMMLYWNDAFPVQNDGFFFSFGCSRRPPPDPASINEESLAVAEAAAHEVLNCVHPTLDAEERRKDVIDYVRRLIKYQLDCEVFSYGSVPLKTYSPDGDIDLTIIRSSSNEESLAHDVLAVLRREELNANAEYEVKDSQYIHAEVKLVKCLVQNIVIDISFNQIGGLCTLCFLEQVDRCVGNNQLFKRSIILVKAWCYYESRILGAHHGLISTYALETLVLYIFRRFHSSINGPLAALYRFLDYFSQFDWETFCISLKGPVYMASLPDIVVETSENGWQDLMLSEEFLENCTEMFSLPSKGPETNPRVFQRKHLNIIDPLNECNNLGRSVHKGNFYRIRSAFKYGAHKLGQVLLQPRERIAVEISGFFANTIARHGHEYGRNICRLALANVDNEALMASLSPPSKLFSEDDFGDFKNSSLEEEAKSLENPCHALMGMYLTSIVGDLEALNPLADLSGDYDSHLRCLLYAQLCHGFPLSTPAFPHPPPSVSQIRNKRSGDTVSRSIPFWQNQFYQVSSNTEFVKPSMHPAADSALPATSFDTERRSQEAPRTTGVPDMNYSAKNNEPSSHNRFQRRRHTPTSSEPNSSGTGTHEPVSAQSIIGGPSYSFCQSPTSVEGDTDANHPSSSCTIEFGTIGNLAEDLISDTSLYWDPTLRFSSRAQGSKAIAGFKK